MTVGIKKHKNDLLFLPLGGANEIGMNLNLYQYKGKWLMVDLGIGFADEDVPGAQILVPDIHFISEHKKDLVGLVITHAHEDHIGAVQYLWHELRCPIYTTKFTAAVLRAKFAEARIPTNELVIIEIGMEQELEVGPFNLQTIGLTHSIPEMAALAISTGEGVVLHTGDWKLDDDPVVGELTNRKALEALGKKGVLAMVSDSTNIFSEGHSGSEGALQNSLVELVGGIKEGLVIVTTFASNIARLYSIAKAAQLSKRKVALVGRSLWRMYEAAKSCGYMTEFDPFITDKEIKDYSRKEVLVIATGCQGEENATIMKLANDAQGNFTLKAGDTIIFSSKIIPGNEKRIFTLFNKLCKKNVEVMTERDHFVHVSGHPSRGEVAKMYQMVKPQIAVPVHGDAIHLHEHAKFSLQHGAKSSVEVENGLVIKLSKNGAEKLGKVESGYMAIDGHFVLPADSPIIRMRSKMRDIGLVVVTVIMDKGGSVAKRPTVIAPGCLDPRDDAGLIDELQGDIYNVLSGNGRISNKVIEQKVRGLLRRFMKHEVGKDLNLIVQIERL
jgi:ribonuclease J